MSGHLLAVFTVPFTHFQMPLGIMVVGVITGMTYGLLALGLTLIYRVSRVINFANAALGAFPAILLPVLVIEVGFNYWLAVPVALVAGVAGGALLERGVIRRLRSASRLVVMVATIAVAQILSVVVAVMPHGVSFLRHDYPTPFHLTATVGHGPDSLRLGSGELLILFIAPVLAVGLALFMKFTHLGLAARASAENSEAALMTGIPVKRVSLFVWGLAGLFAAASAILVAGTQPLSSASEGGGLGPSLLLGGLAAAMIGGFGSFPLVFAGGVAIGLVEALVQWNYTSAGLLNPLLFGLVLLSLVVHRHLGSAARGGASSSWALTGNLRPLSQRLAAHPQVRRAKRWGLIALVGGTALFATTLTHGQNVLLATVLLFAVMGLSLVVLTGFAGQISLGQYAFVAFGAIVGGRMAQLGFPSGSALGYAIIGSGLIAAVMGIPALRVRGLFLAVVTLAFALAADSWLFNQSWLVSGGGSFQSSSSLVILRPKWFGISFAPEVRYDWLCLALLVVVAFFVHRLRSTGIGRAMIAVRDNEPSAVTLSLSPRRVKMVAFILSGMIAGTAGYFYGGLLVEFADAVKPAPIQTSLSLVVMVILGGVTTVTGAVLGALWVQGIPYAFGANIGLLSSGFGVLAVLLIWPGGLASIAFRARDLVVGRITGEKVTRLQEPTTAVPRARLPAHPIDTANAGSTPALAAQGITVRYGGITAVDDVSIHVAPGEILGLLGPNGAGKTTLFDVLSGHHRASSGTVELRGQDITSLRPEQRAQLGLGRTFQQARLFDDLSVFEVVQLGLERSEPSEVVPSVLALPPSWRAEKRKRERAREIVELVGLGPYQSLRVSELSTGIRRVTELACVVAVGADVILLDEPTAGIAQAEVEQFAPVITEIQEHLGATLVIVEHDIPLLMSLADRLYVLAAGRVIAQGPPEEVQSDPAVIEAYLGNDERAVVRSGRSNLRPAPMAATPVPVSKSTAGGSS